MDLIQRGSVIIKFLYEMTRDNLWGEGSAVNRAVPPVPRHKKTLGGARMARPERGQTSKWVTVESNFRRPWTLALSEELQMNKVKEEEVTEFQDMQLKVPIIKTTRLENMCIFQNKIKYGKRRHVIDKILSESYIKTNKSLCTCKERDIQKHNISNKVLLRRLSLLSGSKKNNKFENMRLISISHVDLLTDDSSDEHTLTDVKRIKAKDNNSVHKSEPNTTVSNACDDGMSGNVFEEILPPRHSLFVDERTKSETEKEDSNYVQTSDPLSTVSDTSGQCKMDRCNEEESIAINDLSLKIRHFKNRKFEELLSYMSKKVDLKLIEIMRDKHFNVIIIIENYYLKSTDIYITNKLNIIVEIASVPYNDYSYIYNLYNKSNESNFNTKFSCNILHLQCCCWQNRQHQIAVRVPKDFRRFLTTPHSCINSCLCCYNRKNRKQINVLPLSTASGNMTHSKNSLIQIPQNTLQAEALSFKKKSHKPSSVSYANPTQSYSSVTLQFHYEVTKSKQVADHKQWTETIELGSKGEIVFHDNNIVTNSMNLVRLEIKYVVITDGFIKDDICCRYKYEVVLEKLKSVFKIDNNILTYIRSGHKNLKFYQDKCETCILSSNKTKTVNFKHNYQFKKFGTRDTIPIEYSRRAVANYSKHAVVNNSKQTIVNPSNQASEDHLRPEVIVSQANQPIVQTADIGVGQHKTTTEDDIPINIIFSSPPASVLLQLPPNQKVNLIIPTQEENSKVMPQKRMTQQIRTVNNFQTLPSLQQDCPQNKSQDEIIFPKITEVFSLKESYIVEEVESEVDVKSEIDIEENEIGTGEDDQMIK